MIPVSQIVHVLHSHLPPSPFSIIILIRTGCQRRSNISPGESRRKKAVDVLLSIDMSILKFTEGDNCSESRIQTEKRGSQIFPIWSSRKSYPRKLKFLDAMSVNQKEIVSLTCLPRT